jgi:glycosyltransferase involved in cell wall biosynthesis
VPEPAERDWSKPRYLFIGVDWKRKNGGGALSVRPRLRAASRCAARRLGGHPRIDQPGVVSHGPLSLVDPADRERMAALYGRATAFVMPSLHEPAGIVNLEAAGAGLGIGTTSGGASTMIGPGGILVEPHDGEQIFEAMQRLADPATAQRLGALALAHSSLFTWRKVAERLVRAFAFPDVDTSGLAEFL